MEGGVMMNGENCRKKAQGCMLASQSSTDPHGRLKWRLLAESWLSFAEQRSPPETTLPTSTTRRPVELDEAQRNPVDTKVADLLRERLARAAETRNATTSH
jgi:hypothetical protein